MRFSLTGLLFLAFSHVVAQERFDSQLPFLPGDDLFKKTNFVTAAKDTGRKEISLTIFDKNKLYHAILDSSFNVRQSFSNINAYGTDLIRNLVKDVVTSRFNGEKAWYVHTDVNNTLLVLEVDYANKRMEFVEHLSYSKEDLFKGAYFYGDVLYACFVRPKSKSIKIFRKLPGQPFRVGEQTIVAPSSVASVEDFFTEMSKASLINNNVDATLAESGLRFKIYPNGSQFRCVYDQPGQTIIMDLKYDQYSPTVTIIENEKTGCAASQPVVSNSYLYNNRLYQVNACNERIQVAIKDLPAGSLVKEFSIDPGKELSIANSPIIQEGSSFFQNSGDTKELKGIKALLRKMLDENAAIAVNRSTSGELVMTIGSYEQLKGSSWMYNLLLSPFPTFQLFGPVGMSIGTRYTRWKYTKTAYFKSLFNSQTLEHLPSISAGPAAFDELDKYITENFVIKPGVTPFTVLDLEKEQILFFYSKLKKSYSFVIFNP